MAARAGISEATGEMVHRGQLTTLRMRRRIEAALGQAIWTASGEFAHQQALTSWLGIDPFVVSLKTTRAAARAKGITIAGRNPRSALVLAKLFEAYEVAHPSPAPRRTRAVHKISTAGIPPTGKPENQTQKRTP